VEQGKALAEYIQVLEGMVAARGQPYAPAVPQVMLAFAADMTCCDAFFRLLSILVSDNSW